MKVAFVLATVLTIILVGLLISVLEDQPLVVASSSKQVENAESVSGLVKQLKHTLRRRNQSQNIVLRQDQLDSLVGLAQRAKPEFLAEVDLKQTEVSLNATYKLPGNPLGQYLNLNVLLLPDEGLNIDSVTFGSLSLPGDTVLGFLIWLADWHTDSDIASQFVKQVERVRVFRSNLVITFQPLSDFLKQLNELKNGLSVVQDEPLKTRTAYYLKFVSELSITKIPTYASLAAYMTPLFDEAKKRSVNSEATKENEAAILALAIYAGHHRIANFVGEVQPMEGEVALPTYRPVLANRIDLTRHFLISAALQVLSQQGVSTAIGEFKELMDRGRGGSGYSFVDLAADIAGVRFAIHAGDPKYASQLQETLSKSSSETVFFPNIEGLPEGLNKQAFSQTYGEVDSPAYRLQVAQIEQKIERLSIFKLTE